MWKGVRPTEMKRNERGEPIYAEREFPFGMEGVVIPLTYGRARLCIGEKDSLGFEDAW